MLSPFRKRKFEALFDHLDLNGDGKIDLTDFTRYAERMKAERGWAADDPKVTQLVSGSRRWWEQMLAGVGGKDNVISRNEFLAFWEWVGQQAVAAGAPPPWIVEMCANTHRALDRNGNGTVDATEYALWLRAIGSKASAADTFKKLDVNGDGVVKLDEMLMLFSQFVLSDDPADAGNYLMTGVI